MSLKTAGKWAVGALLQCLLACWIRYAVRSLRKIRLEMERIVIAHAGRLARAYLDGWNCSDEAELRRVCFTSF